MERTRKGGSLLKFMVVGVLLAGLLVGGIYAVKTQFTQPPAPAVQKPEQPVAETPPVEPAAQAPIETVELPTTGPKEIFGSLIMLGLLAAVAVGYARSRRPQLSL